MSPFVQRVEAIALPRRAVFPARREKESVEARAASRLRRSPYGELRHVACRFHEGILCLRGRVSSYYLKQIAQTLVLELDNVEAVNNQLEVIAPFYPR